jgi:hypothetical protein
MMKGMQPRVLVLTLGAALIAVAAGGAQHQLSPADAARLDAAMREAFAFLYALPSDTAAAQMGAWVLDSNATTSALDAAPERRLVVTKLTDTGQQLHMRDVAAGTGTSPAQLAAAMAEMQRLEGQVSKAEADASLEIVVTANAPAVPAGSLADDRQRITLNIAASQLAVQMKGTWRKVEDKELEIEYQRWSPATLRVAFGSFERAETRAADIHSLTVSAQGNDEMIERVVNEAKWSALASLIN